MTYFTLKQIETVASNRNITSITVHYGKKEVTYVWAQRNVIKWNNVTKCRLNYSKPKWYNIDGDACKRPGLKLKPLK